MFEIVHTARLKPRHVEKFLGVSRITASRWLNDHAEPHVQLMGKVERFLSFVRWGLDEGKLPIPSGVAKRDENNYIRELLRAYKTK